MDLFPIFPEIDWSALPGDRRGNLAESKIESLRAANANVTVIAPYARPRILDLAAAETLRITGELTSMAT